MDNQATTQLRLIAEIESVLRSARIRFWLRGGWALDFLIGRVTRQHSDIDLVTWRRHASRIERLLVEAGYRVATVTDLAAIRHLAVSSKNTLRGDNEDQVGHSIGRHVYSVPSWHGCPRRGC